MLAELHVNKQQRNKIILIWVIWVQFGSNLVQFGSIWFNLVQFGPLWSLLVQFVSIWSNLVQLGQIGSYFVQFGPLWSSLVQTMVWLGLIWSNWADLVQLCLWSMMMQMAIFGKFNQQLVHSGSYRATEVHIGHQWSLTGHSGPNREILFECCFNNCWTYSDGSAGINLTKLQLKNWKENMLAEIHVNNQKRNQRSNLVYLGGSNLVQFGPFWVQFGSIWSVLVQFGSNRSYLVLFGPHNGLADLVQLCL